MNGVRESMDALWVKLVVGLIFVGYTGYTTYKSIRLFVTFQKKFANFKEVHKKYTLYVDNGFLWIASGVLAGFSFVMAFYCYANTTVDQRFYVVLAYFCIGIIFVGLAFETYVRKRCFFIEEGIFYVEKIYRFRMMIRFEQRKRSLFKNIRIMMADGEKFEVSHKLGLKLEECSKTRRAKKKSKQKQTGDK